jgi:hypothetical protein
MANQEAWAAGWAKGSEKESKGKDKNSSSAGDSGKSAWSIGFDSKAAKPSSYKKGGKVKKTGTAKVHKGEIVLTAAQAKMCAQKADKRKAGGKVLAKKG